MDDAHEAPAAAQRPPEAELACAPLVAACGLAPERWAALRHEAERLGAHPLDLALGEGALDESRFLAALAAQTGLTFAPQPPPARAGTRAEEAFALRSYTSESGARVVSATGAIADLLLRRAAAGAAAGLILTTRQAQLDRLVAVDAARLARKAAFDLPEMFSARRFGPLWQRLRRLAIIAGFVLALVLALGGTFAPLTTLVLPPLLFAPLFLVAGLAVLTATLESLNPPRAALLPERAALPRYAVLVPLYREAGVVPKLVERLGALLYPRDRLEIFYLVEEDDAETLAAFAALALPPSQLVMRLPPGEPRTKPRALNLGLPFAGGDFTVVYDAEDAPEPDQLLRAAALFRSLPREVACLQGRLGIANWRDGFLACRFAIDYAALFDCVKAGMGRAAWPVPLGGTSNHFRTGVLRRIGGWDAWNVTEDADLGLRLARLGYIVEDLPSTTWEEAPNALKPWMNQRTRWMKGWVQTMMVHLSSPAQALRGLGLFRFGMMGAIGLSVILGALLYPVFLFTVILRFFDPAPFGQSGVLMAGADAMLLLALSVAVLVELVPGTLALWHRGALRLAPLILLAPVTHLMVSFAAWRALVDLLRRPFFWHKTDHGLARHEEALGALRSTTKKRRA